MMSNLKLLSYTRKVVNGSLTYYFRENLKDQLMVDITGSPVSSMELVKDRHLMQFSEFVIDTTNNTFVKCRFPLYDLVNRYGTVRQYDESM